MPRGELVEIQEKVTLVALTVVTNNMSANEIAVEYGFTEKQVEMLDELLREESVNFWEEILGE